MYVKELQGVSKKIKRCEVWDAQETLGIYIAPDGNTTQQVSKMKELATNWADQMRTGCIAREEVWLALNSTIMRTLYYPALNLTKSQCKDIMRPLLFYGLPAMGICRNFPRDLVFAPALYLGIGIKHLYTVQEISRLKDIILHTHASTTTGQLYRTSFELLIIELG